MGRHPDPTLNQRNIVIGLLTAGLMSKLIANHFQAFEGTIFNQKTKIRHTGSVKNRQHPYIPRATNRREDIDNVTSFRRNGFLSSVQNTWLGNKCHGNFDLCQNNSKTTEGCEAVLMSLKRWCPVCCFR